MIYKYYVRTACEQCIVVQKGSSKKEVILKILEKFESIDELRLLETFTG